MGVKLHVDFCDTDAARFACKRWHYSGVASIAGGAVRFGVWEDDRFIGCVLYAKGANKDLFKPYGIKKSEGLELTRIALCRDHSAPVSRIISITLKLIRKHWPGIKLIVSFADTEQGHHGGIYQGSNFYYLGLSIAADEYIVAGKRYHGRSYRSRFGTGAKVGRQIKGSRKHRYVYPFTEELRDYCKTQSKPFPKRDAPMM